MAADFFHGCHRFPVRTFRDVIDIYGQGRHRFSVWIFRDVIAVSRHGRHRFSLRIFRGIIAFNPHRCHSFSSRCDKFVADFVTHLNWFVFYICLLAGLSTVLQDIVKVPWSWRFLPAFCFLSAALKAYMFGGGFCLISIPRDFFTARMW